MTNSASSALPSDMHQRQQAYIKSGMRRVDGWLAPDSAKVIAHLANVQSGSGITGGMGEIGIHHGKLFLLLYLSLQPEERAFALDIFENQQLNKDGSGHGNKEVFLGNLQRIGGDAARVAIFAQDSGSVSAPTLVSAVGGPLRLMSVDGGHTEDITHNDMRLAEEALRDDGILVLDDMYNERWPAVTAGACRFVLEPGRKLRPFAVSPNKTYFCKDKEAAHRYRTALSETFWPLVLGHADMFGSDVLILGNYSLKNHIRNIPFIRDHPKLYRGLAKAANWWR